MSQSPFQKFTNKFCNNKTKWSFCKAKNAMWRKKANSPSQRGFGRREKNKKANFVIFDKPMSSSDTFVQNYAWRTFIEGKIVFALDEL
jgi:hypothetical protein